VFTGTATSRTELSDIAIMNSPNSNDELFGIASISPKMPQASVDSVQLIG
jgi:hypothetical protein